MSHVISQTILRAMANTAGETDDGDCWDSDGLGYHTPGDDEGGDMEMPEAACDDCGPLRDRPASVSAVAARGKHSRTGCTPIAAAESVYVAARRLRNLAHGVLGPALTLGSRAGRENRALQCMCILQRHCHPSVEERMHGRPPGAADGAAGHDSDGFLALLPMAGGGGFDVVRAVKENPSALHEVTSEDLKTADDWLAFLDAQGASLKDNERERNRAMVLFRRVSRLAVGCNGEAGAADVPVWGTSVLLAVRRDERLVHAKTLVFFHDGAAAVDVGSTLQQRLACARRKWLCDAHFPLALADLGQGLVQPLRTKADVAKMCQDARGDLQHRGVPPNSDDPILYFMQGMSFEERSANGGESFSGSSQEQVSAEGCSQQSAGGLSSPHSSSYGTHSSPGAQSWVSPEGVVNRGGRALMVVDSPMDVFDSPAHPDVGGDVTMDISPSLEVQIGAGTGEVQGGDDSELSLNETRSDDSEDVRENRECCVVVLCFDREL